MAPPFRPQQQNFELSGLIQAQAKLRQCAHPGRKTRSLTNSLEKHVKCCTSVVPAFEPKEQNFELRCTLYTAVGTPGKPEFCLIQKKSVVCQIPHVLVAFLWRRHLDFELSGWILTTHTYTAHTKKV